MKGRVRPRESEEFDETGNFMNVRDFFIINPAAGMKNSVNELKAKIQAAFSSLQKECEILVTSCRGEATRLVKEAASRVKEGELRFYACGGDGTFNEVAQGAVGDPRLSVAPVPTGSGNDFIRCFREYQAQDFLDLARLARGPVRTVDVMEVNGKLCFNVASVGLDAVTAKLMPALRRFPLLGGRLSYVLALGCAFFTATKNRFSFEVDGKPLDYGKEHCIISTVANGCFYGGGFQTAPRAQPDDGLLDFLCVPSVSRLRFLALVGLYKRGEHLDKIPFIRFQTCKRVRIVTEKTVPVNIDGEIFEMKDPCVRILEKALKVILPEKSLAAR